MRTDSRFGPFRFGPGINPVVTASSRSWSRAASAYLAATFGSIVAMVVIDPFSKALMGVLFACLLLLVLALSAIFGVMGGAGRGRFHVAKVAPPSPAQDRPLWDRTLAGPA